ncbi:MAG TPA: 3-hydroxyacyl-CoA dehydrogenase NAD-binding domain-containing protein [Burkholderiales bacterium]|nr:3-hydroxyacyl-CoA dehydrogenase NAD-binding domain-containing protein [Burkholderiales bacterium]
MSNLVEYQVQGPVGVITLNNPPVNALAVNKGVPQGILDSIKESEHDPHVRGLLLIGAGRNFCGGADISEFGKDYDPGMATLPDVLAYMDTVTKPIFAALAGPTMGGGLELAMACHYRCAAPDAQLALPEVKLGILPGAGGTQRLPRLIGVERALDMMVSGDPIGAEQAKSLGLVEEVVTGDLRQGALSWVRRALHEGWGIRRASALGARLDQPATEFFPAARERVARAWRGYPAPAAIVDCVEAAVTQPFAKGLQFERSQFVRLVKTNESRALRHLFFAERAAAKIADVPADTPAREIGKAAVIGAGTMGGGIAMCFANAGIPVAVIETGQEALGKGIETIRRNYANTVAKGRLTQQAMDKRMALIRGGLDFAALKDADIVVEAVFEEMPVKKEVFAKLDALAKPGAILATNTSTLDVNEIAAATARPESVLGLHFFSPANVMRLLEVVRGARTSNQTLATGMKVGKLLKKVPVCVGVCDGFVGNRMIHKYLREAGFLLEEGALPQQVDAAMEAFGLAMGPFRMSDLAGLDVGWRIRKRQAATRPRSERYSRIGDMICELGRFGQKTGAGYYRYEKGSRDAIPDPEIEALIVRASGEAGIARRRIADEEIVERLMHQLVNEGARILEEGIAQRASDIDVIYAFGYGFPRYRGGPMFYADTVGLDKVLAATEKYHADHGEMWAPAPLLAKLAAEGGKFNG